MNPWKFDTNVERISPPPLSLDTILFQGLFPRIYDKNLLAHDWLGSYYQTYVERDVRNILNIGDLSSFQRFVRAPVGQHNYSIFPLWLLIAALRIQQLRDGCRYLKQAV